MCMYIVCSPTLTIKSQARVGKHTIHGSYILSVMYFLYVISVIIDYLNGGIYIISII